MIPTVIKVFLSDDPSSAVDVPITPNTTALDVVECCKEPGEVACHLAEIWKGRERCVASTEKPFTILQQWSSQASEVYFFLRHCAPPNVTVKENAITGEKTWNTEQMDVHKMDEIHTYQPDCDNMSLAELKDVAQKQQHQIEQQQRTLVGKEQRLR